MQVFARWARIQGWCSTNSDVLLFIFSQGSSIYNAYK